LLEPAENRAAYEYRVLVTSLAGEGVSIVQHYGIGPLVKITLMKSKTNGAGADLSPQKSSLAD
jgi:hypothetical protein